MIVQSISQHFDATFECHAIQGNCFIFLKGLSITSHYVDYIYMNSYIFK